MLWTIAFYSFHIVIPTCSYWLTAQHTHTRQQNICQLWPVCYHGHCITQTSEYIFLSAIFCRVRTFKSVFWDKEPLGWFQLWFLLFVVFPASLLLLLNTPQPQTWWVPNLNSGNYWNELRKMFLCDITLPKCKVSMNACLISCALR